MAKFAHQKNILFPVIRDLANGLSVTCFEDQWINPVFIEDIAEVLKRAFQQKLTGVFHLGTRRTFTRVELGEFLAKTLGYDPRLIKYARLSEARFSEPRPSHHLLNSEKVSAILDFQFCEIEDAALDLVCSP
jgi:dTDP-4-dehydrorhamnose reductase